MAIDSVTSRHPICIDIGTLNVRLTDSDAFSACRRQDERDDGQHGEDAAGQDHIHDVVEGLALQLERELNLRVRHLAAVVLDQIHLRRNVCNPTSDFCMVNANNIQLLLSRMH